MKFTGTDNYVATQDLMLAVNAAMAVGGGSERNAVPPYDIAQQHIVNHRVLAMPLRVSALRALGAPVNVLAAEGMMDMLAQQLGQDVFSLRLAHLTDARACAEWLLEQPEVDHDAATRRLQHLLVQRVDFLLLRALAGFR